MKADLMQLYIWSGFHGKNGEQIRAMASKQFPGAKVDDKEMRVGICEGQRLKKMGMSKCSGSDCPVCNPSMRGGQ